MITGDNCPVPGSRQQLFVKGARNEAGVGREPVLLRLALTSCPAWRRCRMHLCPLCEFAEFSLHLLLAKKHPKTSGRKKPSLSQPFGCSAAHSHLPRLDSPRAVCAICGTLPCRGLTSPRQKRFLRPACTSAVTEAER